MSRKLWPAVAGVVTVWVGVLGASTEAHAQLSVTMSKTDVSCRGGSNGTATGVPSGGVGPYAYSWSSSVATTQTITGLMANDYTVTVTDTGNGNATVQGTVTVGQPATSIGATTSFTPASPGGSDGTATITASGGIPPYTYSWSPSGGNAATATGLAPGLYMVMAFDANSCAAFRNITVTERQAVVTSVAVPPAATYGPGDILTFTVNFDAPVAVTGTPSLDIVLDTGGTVPAAYFGGSGTSVLTFRYTVAAGELDPTGIVIGSPVVLNGGTMRVGAINVNRTLNAVGNTGGVFVGAVAAPAPVPTLSEGAMILFGMLLAGGAAVYVQRRRVAA